MVLFQIGDCRFCGTSEGVKINIFDSVCDHVSKIEMILPLQMVASENMPKVMCHRCMHQINEFYDFRRKCLSLDLKWRARLITLESNSSNAQVLPVTIKLEPPDPDLPAEISSENTPSAATYGWSYTPESELTNHGAAVTTVTTDKQGKQKRAVNAISIEEDKRKRGDPGKAVPQNIIANKDATSSLAKRGKKTNRKTTIISPPKDHKRKRNEKKNDVKDEIKNDGKKSVLRAAVKSSALPENTSLTTSHVKTPVQVTPNLEVQKVPPSRTPLPEKTTKTTKVQKLKPNIAEGVSVSPQTSSKEPPNLTTSQVKANPEKQTTISSKITHNQKVTSLELPKPPTDSEKPLPSHIIMTSIPNVCSIYTCSLCERTFTSRGLACCHNDCVKMKNSSNIETDEGDSKEGIYACSHCDMTFTRHACLVPHEETHILNKIAEDSDTLSSSSDEETSRKRKKKTSRSSPMEIDSLKNIPDALHSKLHQN